MNGRIQIRARAPAAVTLVVGSCALIATTLVSDLLNLSLHRALAVAALVAGAASFGARPAAAAYLGVVSFALFNGFVEDREGLLTFHGRDDLIRFGVLVLVPAGVAVLTGLLGATRSRSG